MLERIDEQTAAMSQRSERLKMMKLQYQMYFAKLVQNQTLRCIQQTTTTATGAPTAAGGAMPMPVLLQPQPQLTNPQPTPQNWTFAMATPTQAGMVLTPQFAAGMPGTMPFSMAPPVASNPAPHPVYYPKLFGGSAAAPLGTSNLFDLRATLRAFDNENADLPERMQPHLTGDYQAELGGRATPATPTAGTSSTSNQEKGARQLSSTSSTLATSSLTFDKLPKTPPSPSPSLTLTELPTAGAGAGGGSGAATSGHDVGGPPQGEADDLDLNLDAWTNSRVTKVEYEKSPTVVGHNEPSQRHRQLQQQHQQKQQQQQQQQHDFEAYFGELKIDEPWQDSTAGTSPSPMEDKRPLNVRSGDVAGGSGMGAKVGISNDLLDEVKASRLALEKAAAAVDEQLARGNQLSPPVSQETMPSFHQPKPGVSIENIENAIYGERLTGNATASAGAGGAVPGTAPAGGGASPTQGFFENLVTNTSPTELERRELEEQQQQQQLEPEVAGYGQYDASSYGDASEPIYASIDSGNLQPESAAVEPLYSEIGNPTDYQAYATDAGAAGDTPAQAAASEVAASAGDAGGEVALPQEYSNIDYSNYEAGQYAGGYDPNAYPGYIYDEATGQYIADPNATQYAPDGSYAGQEYDASAVQNYDYSAYEQHQQQSEQQQQQQQQQQPQEELQQQEAYPVTEKKTPEAEETPAATAAPAGPEPSQAANKPLKPTSILSTTDKQAAPNDAQQQQQQKKKKRVNFVDSSETDDSSSAKPTPAANPGPAATTTSANASTVSNATTPPVGGSESDFDFSTGSEAKN
nr:RNA polymerase II degradation factor 1 [Drosophila kikkawai]